MAKLREKHKQQEKEEARARSRPRDLGSKTPSKASYIDKAYPPLGHKKRRHEDTVHTLVPSQEIEDQPAEQQAELTLDIKVLPSETDESSTVVSKPTKKVTFGDFEAEVLYESPVPLELSTTAEHIMEPMDTNEHLDLEEAIKDVQLQRHQSSLPVLSPQGTSPKTTELSPWSKQTTILMQ